MKKFKKEIASEFDVQKMILFGSRAKGIFGKYSNYDLLVVSKQFKDMNRPDRHYGLYLNWTMNSPVDFLCYTPQEFNRLKKQATIVREAVREGIEI